MSTFTQRDTQVLSDIVHAANNNDLTSPAFWSEMLELIRKAMPFECGSVNLCDIARDEENKIVGISCPRFSPDNSHPGHDLVHHLTAKAIAMHKTVWRPTDIVPKQVWEDMEIYRDHLAPLGLRHFLNALFWNGDSVVCRMYLARTAAQSIFTRKEVQFLALVVRHVNDSIRTSHLLRDAVAFRSKFQAGIDQLSEPVFLFDDNLELVYINLKARAICARCPEGEEAGIEAVRSVAAGLHAELETSPEARHPESFCSLGQSNYLLRGFAVNLPNSRRHLGVLAVDTFKAVENWVTTGLSRIGLSPLEREICLMLARKSFADDLGERLGLSESELDGHVKNILDKLGLMDKQDIPGRILEL